MTPTPDADAQLRFVANYFYHQLMSATRAKDVALYFFRREMEKQRATEDDFRYVSLQYAEHFLKRISALKKPDGSDPSDQEVEEAVRDSIEVAKRQYASRH